MHEGQMRVAGELSKPRSQGLFSSRKDPGNDVVVYALVFD